MKPHIHRHHIIRSLESKALKNRSAGERLADKLTLFFGTPAFLILNTIIFFFWIILNSRLLPIPAFDPYPYILLITFVSLEAIILTTVVLMSQNRQNHLDTLREELQLQVEFIAEKEITKILELLIVLLKHHHINSDDPEVNEMLKTINTSYITRKLEEQIQTKPSKSSSVTEKVEINLEST